MALSKDEKNLLVAFLWLIGVVVVGSLVWYLVKTHMSDDAAKTAAKAPPITHVKPIRPKTVVKKSDNLQALGQNVTSGGQGAGANTSAQGQAMPEVSAEVEDLPTLASVPPESAPPVLRPIVGSVEKNPSAAKALLSRGIAPFGAEPVRVRWLCHQLWGRRH